MISPETTAQIRKELKDVDGRELLALGIYSTVMNVYAALDRLDELELEQRTLPKSSTRVKLSPAQWEMLFSAADHGDPYYHISGQSAHGGAAGTYAKLTRLKLLDDNGITEAGREAVKVKRFRL